MPTLLPADNTLTVFPRVDAAAPDRYWHDQPRVFFGNANVPK
jgi:hypothetical protein